MELPWTCLCPIVVAIGDVDVDVDVGNDNDDDVGDDNKEGAVARRPERGLLPNAARRMMEGLCRSHCGCCCSC